MPRLDECEYRVGPPDTGCSYGTATPRCAKFLCAHLLHCSGIKRAQTKSFQASEVAAARRVVRCCMNELHFCDRHALSRHGPARQRADLPECAETSATRTTPQSRHSRSAGRLCRARAVSVS